MDYKLVGTKMNARGLLSTNLKFTACKMDFISLSAGQIKGAAFEACSLRDAHFSESDLYGATFKTCDLNRTLFFRTNLERVDFRTSFNIGMDPDQNRLKKARFSIRSLPGLLQKNGIEIDFNP